MKRARTSRKGISGALSVLWLAVLGGGLLGCPKYTEPGSSRYQAIAELSLPHGLVVNRAGGGLRITRTDLSADTFLGEYAVTADGTIVGRGSKQYPANPSQSTPAPTYMKDIRGKKGPDGGRNIGWGETAPIGFIVPAGSLGLSVAVFTVCALTTIAVLY